MGNTTDEKKRSRAMRKYRDDYKLVTKVDERGREITTTSYMGNDVNNNNDPNLLVHIR